MDRSSVGVVDPFCAGDGETRSRTTQAHGCPCAPSLSSVSKETIVGLGHLPSSHVGVLSFVVLRSTRGPLVPVRRGCAPSVHPTTVRRTTSWCSGARPAVAEPDNTTMSSPGQGKEVGVCVRTRVDERLELLIFVYVDPLD